MENKLKVLMINGSPRKDGNTSIALREMEKVFQENGVEVETVQVGNKAIRGCVACNSCAEKGKCVFDDVVNEITTKAKDCDGFIFASPVYYAHPSARLLAVLDRAFYSNKSVFVYKPGACIFSARRAGQVASMDVVNKHFSISHMPIVSANYWNEVFGSEPEDVYKDAEGVATMQNIAKNMSWLLKSIEAGKKAGLERPELSTGHTNFHH